VRHVISLFHTKLQRPLKILSDDEAQQIHSATLEVLENVGVRFEDEAVLKLLQEQGAHRSKDAFGEDSPVTSRGSHQVVPKESHTLR